MREIAIYNEQRARYHGFPPSSVIAPLTAPLLRQLGFGYREKLIQKKAALLLNAHGTNKYFFSLSASRAAGTAGTREGLVKLMRVEWKIADCMLLLWYVYRIL